ncbi:MAG: DUF4838 domain-containing protein [Lentisphaerae bacterium]|nr:DUF4838 domain-containing protein [Lentisphaerota bacterium]
MSKKIFSALLGILCLGAAAANVPIVENGQARAVIVRGNTGRACEMAVRELHKAILECSGADLQIVDADKLQSVDPKMTRLIVGNCKYATEAGFGHETMKDEENVVAVKGRDVFFNGRNWDKPKLRVYGAPQPPVNDIDPRRFSPAELFAVTEFMDRVLGVRILWPGESGRYYPKHSNISLPDNYVFRTQPKYEYRHPWYRPGKDTLAVTEYLLMHRQCARIRLAFQDRVFMYWNKYQKDHPEIFAKNPKGETAYWEKPGYAKFCMSNPGTADFLMERWRESGKPDITPLLIPTDGKGDCCCPECRKLDPPEIQNASAEDIWLGKVQVTGRYVDFWNKMLSRMQKENPKARACIFGYDAYRNFPEGKKLIPGFLVGVVPGFNIFNVKEYNIMKQWTRSGGVLFLRPNWQHVGYCLPYMPLKPMEKYIRTAEASGIVGYELDRLVKHWALDGFTNYAYIRLLNRSDLTMEDIKKEFASAFGKGAPEIVKYLNYWEQHTYKIFGSKNGEFTDGLGDGLLKQELAKHKWIRNGPMFWLMDAWPFLYSEEYLKPAEAFLVEAEKLIGKEDPKALERVQFLRGGLEYVRQNTVCMNLYWKKPTGRTAEYLAERKKMLSLRKKLSEIGAVDWIFATEMEFGLKLRTVPATSKGGWPKIPKNYKDPNALQ